MRVQGEWKIIRLIATIKQERKQRDKSSRRVGSNEVNKENKKRKEAKEI